MANESFTSILLKLKEKGFFKNLIIKRGIEKEFFRVDKNGNISNSSHPISLGSALTNKFITTDFAEAQLELVTPVFENINDLSNFLYSLHVFVAKNIDSNEFKFNGFYGKYQGKIVVRNKEYDFDNPMYLPPSPYIPEESDLPFVTIMEQTVNLGEEWNLTINDDLLDKLSASIGKENIKLDYNTYHIN